MEAQGITDVSGTTTEELVAKIYHTDGRVSAIESKIDTLASGQLRIENALLNKPPAWNNTTIMGLVIGVGAFLVGITGYVDLQLSPVKEILVHDAEWKVDKDEFQRATHYRYGEMDAYVRNDNERFRHHDDQFHSLDGRVRSLEQSNAAGQQILKERGELIDRDREDITLLQRELLSHIKENDYE